MREREINSKIVRWTEGDINRKRDDRQPEKERERTSMKIYWYVLLVCRNLIEWER